MEGLQKYITWFFFTLHLKYTRWKTHNSKRRNLEQEAKCFLCTLTILTTCKGHVLTWAALLSTSVFFSGLLSTIPLSQPTTATLFYLV